MAAKSKWGVNMQKEIRDLVKKYNLSQEDIASRLGVSFRNLYTSYFCLISSLVFE